MNAPAIDSSFCVLAVNADARDFRLDMAQRLTERLAARSRPRALQLLTTTLLTVPDHTVAKAHEAGVDVALAVNRPWAPLAKPSECHFCGMGRSQRCVCSLHWARKKFALSPSSKRDRVRVTATRRSVVLSRPITGAWLAKHPSCGCVPSIQSILRIIENSGYENVGGENRSTENASCHSPTSQTVQLLPKDSWTDRRGRGGIIRNKSQLAGASPRSSG